MSDESNEADGDVFEEVWIDLNGFTAKDWDELRDLAKELRDSNYFKADPFKCSIGAFVIWIAAGHGRSHQVADDGTLLN